MDEQNQNHSCCCCGGQVKTVLGWLGAVLAVILIIAGALLIRNWYKSYDYIGKGNIRDMVNFEGMGKVTAIPDIATFTIGVQTEKTTVADAQKENNDKMNKIISAMKDLGVKADDLQTTDYNIYPQYDYPTGRQVLRGYQVNQSILVKVRDMNKVGNLFAKAGELGANNVGGLNFTIDDPEIYRADARIKAIKNAQEKAEVLSKATGIKLGKIVSFAESGTTPPGPIYYDKAIGLGMGGAGSSVTPPDIQSGNQEVVVNVVVSYEVL